MKDEFSARLDALTQNMAKGFTSAYNETETIRRRGESGQSEIFSQTGMGPNNTIHVEVNCKGDIADLFARTFTDAVRAAGASDVERNRVFSEKTGEESDRKIVF